MRLQVGFAEEYNEKMSGSAAAGDHPGVGFSDDLQDSALSILEGGRGRRFESRVFIEHLIMNKNLCLILKD